MIQKISNPTRVFIIHCLQLIFTKGTSRVVSLATVPFLIRTIGIAQYGTLEFVKAITWYATILISYGFHYSAAKQIHQHRHDHTIIGQLLGAIYTIKIILIGASLIFISLASYYVPSIYELRRYFLYFFLVVIASTLFPVFVFQGLGKLHWATVLNLVFKLLYLAGIFIFIRRPSDAILYPILLAIADILRLVVAFYLVYYRLGIAMKRPPWHMIHQQLREGLHIFLPRLSIIFYAKLPTIVLGFLLGPRSVAIYSLGERIIRTTVGMTEPVTQALFPISSQKIAHNLREGFKFVWSATCLCVAIFLMVGAIYWLLSSSIIKLLASTPIPEAENILKLHAFLPSIFILSNILGINALIPAGAGKKYTLTMFMTGLLCAALHWVLVPHWQAQGAAWAMLLSEIFTTVAMIFWTLQIYFQAYKKN